MAGEWRGVARPPESKASRQLRACVALWGRCTTEHLRKGGYPPIGYGCCVAGGVVMQIRHGWAGQWAGAYADETVTAGLAGGRAGRRAVGAGRWDRERGGRGARPGWGGGRSHDPGLLVPGEPRAGSAAGLAGGQPGRAL